MCEVAFAIHWPEGAPARGGGARRRFAGLTMGTSWQVDLFGLSAWADPLVQAGLERELERLVAQMSHWRADSDVTRFSHAAAGAWVRLPVEVLEVLAAAQQVCRISGGAFDPAVGPAVDAWGFGPAQATPRIAPAPMRLAASVAEIEIDAQSRSARQPGNVRLDLSAIAKGYAVDRLAGLLSEWGAASFLVEVGGEFRASGLKPDAQPWWIDLETPPGLMAVRRIRVALSGQSIATSGDYRHFSIVDGRRRSHTIDPATANPVAHNLASVTVICPLCHMADALSTAIFVLGPERGLAFATEQQIAAVLSTRSGDALSTVVSPAFEQLLEP